MVWSYVRCMVKGHVIYFFCDHVTYLVTFVPSQDALRVMQQVTRTVDNAIVMSNLKSCPYSLDITRVVRADPFNMYTTNRKKRIRETVVILHRDYIIFTQPHHGNREGVERTAYEYVESLQVSRGKPKKRRRRGRGRGRGRGEGGGESVAREL